MIPVRFVLGIGPDAPAAEAAAAIALLSLRASLNVLGDAALPDQFRVESDDSLRTLAETARLVASLSKPLRYRGEVYDGAITVRFEGPHDSQARVARSPGGLLWFVRQRHASGSDRLRVACLGAGRLLRVNMAAFAAWERDYELGELWSCGADFADSSYPTGQGVRPDDIRDCVALVSFGAGPRPIDDKDLALFELMNEWLWSRGDPDEVD